VTRTGRFAVKMWAKCSNDASRGRRMAWQEEQPMSSSRILGIILLVIGVILLVLGLQATDSFGERISNTFTGHWSDKTNFYIVGGAVAAVVGVVLTFMGGGRALKA